MRKKLVVGNWKMHGGLAFNARLLDALCSAGKSTCAAAVCVPFPYLHQAQSLLEGSGIAWGAQDLSEQVCEGAYTGEVSGAMLVDFGCRFVIVGHSERRALYRESEELVAVKVEAALASGLVPILCVGETLDERERGVTESVIDRQLDAVFKRVGDVALASCVLAYEPVWAIGTGVTASPGQAQSVHAFVRSRLVAWCGESAAAQTTILYGGSVKPQNAAELFSQSDIDGGLIGGASLVAGDFLAIMAAAAS
jgi:triosephosphate isomerase